MTLRPYQQQIVEHICRHPRTNLFVPMGAGKTMAVLTALDNLNLAGHEVFPALVVAPLRVAVSTWPAERRKWPHLQHLRMTAITGHHRERLAAMRAPDHVYTINYENLEWLEKYLQKGIINTIVADECTRLKGFRTRQGSKRAAALARIAADCKRYIGLTGTPASNGLKDLWGVQWFTDRGERLGKSYSAYMSRWFKDTAPYANYPVYEPMPHAEREIHEKIADITISIDLKDYLDLKEPVHNPIEVDLPAPARRVYDDMHKEMVAELKRGEITAVNAAVKTAKCLQIASGAVYTDDTGTWEEVHRAKIDALESIVEEAGGAPVLVAYHYKHDLERLKKAFPKGRELDKSPKTIEAWNAGKIPLLFAHPASAGHGLNLQDGGNILVFFSLNWNLEEHLQIIERIGPARQAQAGHDRPVFIHYILARDTLDQVVLERLRSKRSVVDVLMEAMK